MEDGVERGGSLELRDGRGRGGEGKGKDREGR